MNARLHIHHCHSCQILMKHAFSSETLEKYSYIIFHENRPVGATFFHVAR